MTMPGPLQTDPDPSPVQANITAQNGGEVHAPLIVGSVIQGPLIINSHSNCQAACSCPTAERCQTSPNNPKQITCKDNDPDYRDLSTRLKSILREQYERILDGNSLTGHRRYLNDIYTELYVVENETGGVIQEHEVRQIEAASAKHAWKDIPVKCSDIFKVQPETNRRNKKVLTMGIAGVGKTFSVNKFILDWAEGKDNQDIDFIFPLPFRELNMKKEASISLMELLQDCLPGSIEFHSLPVVEGKVLFIFDGLDECRFRLNFNDKTEEKLSDMNKKTSVGAIITHLVNRNLLCSALVWITSRPAAAHLIPRDYIDQVTEVRGFNDEQKEEYFNRYCNEDLAKQIIPHIKKSRSLYIMCHIPVFCWISATVLEPLLARSCDTNSGSQEIPTTLTGMYIHFLVQQANQMKNKYIAGSPNNVDSKHIVLKLGELAFYELEKGNFVFYEKDLVAYGIDVSGGSVYSGLCTQIFKTEKSSSERMMYSFVHLSVQEALAAVHIFYSYVIYKKNPFIQTFGAKLKWWFKHSRYELHKSAVRRALRSKNGHLDLFLRFLLGLSIKKNVSDLKDLLPEDQGIEEKFRSTSDSVNDTVDYIKKKINSAESADRSFNLFHCLSELEDNSLISEVQNFLMSGELFAKNLMSTQWLALVFVLLMSEETQKMFELKKYRGSDEGLKNLLPVVKNTARGLLDCCQLTEPSFILLASIFESNSYLRELDLSNNDLQDSGLELLSEGLKSSHCKVEILRLSGCMITEKGCSSLASALSSNPSYLRELDLSYNHIGDSGVRQLSERLDDQNYKLEILNFENGGEERLKAGLWKYAYDLTLDPDTAHADLSLSNGNRTVLWEKDKHTPPDHPDRFDFWSQVLCKESLFGRCYWEVEWSEIGVHIGVAYKDIGRKGKGNECWFGQSEKSWSLDCTKNQYTARHNGIKITIAASGHCSYRIGVYLDWSSGHLSFYNVWPDTRKIAHIHTFHATFTHPLYTGFMVLDSTVSLCKLE